MKFADLRLAEPIVRALTAEGYVTATPVQAQAIPHAVEGRDVLGCAQTGTGKTAAFAAPILHRLSQGAQIAPTTHAPNTTHVSHAHTAHSPHENGEQARRLNAQRHAPVAGAPRSPRARCLVLCPTRELATQIADSFRVYGKNVQLRHTIIFGGVGQNPQVDALRRGVDIIVATPGRLLDLLDQGHVNLSGIEILVLDEADRMLDMGFINDIRKIVAKLPAKRQTLLFSATMPPEIRRLADSLLRDPVTVQVAAVASTTELIDESVYFVEKRNKPALLAHLVNELPMSRAIVFTRTKRGADRVVRHLHTRGIRAEAIHGNKSQSQRQRALDNFKSAKTPVLVATDVASRGIDIDMVSHVVNFDLSQEPETYVHRIGRTGRAGATGAAISFCDPEERPYLKAIERLIRRSVPVKTEHPNYTAAEHAPAAPAGHPRQSHGAHAHAEHTSRGHAPRPAAHAPAAARHPVASPRQGGGASGRHPFQSKGRPGSGTGRSRGGPRRRWS